MSFRKNWLMIILVLFAVNVIPAPAANVPQKCVQIYYDSSDSSGKNYFLGRAYTINLQNLVSHFVDIQPYIIPIEYYKSGQIERCFASIYLGSADDNAVPKTFLKDFVATKKNVMWINDGISQLQPYNLKKLWGAQYLGIAGMDYRNKEPDGSPGGYKYFIYKGETFVSNIPKRELEQDFYARNINILYLANQKQQKNYTVAWAKHSTREAMTPYILRNKNHWYVAANPFAYMGDDKYLIFADLMFDVLDEQPVDHGKKYALIRLEDVHPQTNTKAIKIIIDLFAKNNVPFAIALIPIYKDPLGIYTSGVKQEQTIDQNYSFLKALKYAKEHNASFIWHGVTHQYDNLKNPYGGVTGEDFEFWNGVNEMPLTKDSVNYVMSLLSSGYQILSNAGISPIAWLTPHYAASPLDYIMFGQLFNWNVGQVRYTLANICQPSPLPEKYSFDTAGYNSSVDKIRRDNFARIKITNMKNFGGSGSPYTVYRDYYGQRLIPDFLGHILPLVSEQVKAVKNSEDIIAAAKRNLVLRDVWASFAFHTIMLNTKAKGGIAKRPGSTEKLQKIIDALKADGYTFVDLKTWTQQNKNVRAPAPIEVGPYANQCD